MPRISSKVLRKFKRIYSTISRYLFLNTLFHKHARQLGYHMFFYVRKARIQFNAHRIYEVEQIIEMFKPLSLESFALVDDENQFTVNADFKVANRQKYGCGCFHFTKKTET